jgi:hypothetical protein
MQNSLRQQVFPSFETDKKWTGGRQNADKHPDQNLTGLVSKYITKGLPILFGFEDPGSDQKL